MTHALRYAPLALLALSFPMNAAAADSLSLFSATLDAKWNYGNPAESEQRFRAEIAMWPPGDPQALIVETQIARTQSLQGQFSEANATLDAVAAALPDAPSHVRVRYLLERGRTLNSSGSPERAVPLFAEAMSLAACSGDDFYAVDAAHMLGIAAPSSERMEWNMKALAMTEKSADPRTRRWLAALYNNIGYTYQERGDYPNALIYYRKALPAYESRGDPGAVRAARWMIARAQRSLGQLDEAETTQLALLAEYDKLGEPDGYVYEELAEIARARGDATGAKPWAAKAYALLSTDPSLRADPDRRLARLAKIGDVAPSTGGAK